MSRLIKAGQSGGAVRCLGHGVARQPPEMLLVADPAQARLVALEEEVAALRAALAEAATAAAETAETAREEGRAAAAAGATRDDEARIEAVRAGIADALRSWEERLDSMEGLAALLARSALAKLFDETDDLAELVLRTLGRNIGALGREAVVVIRVSPRDFPDESALAEIGARLRLAKAEAVADPALGPGECRLDLRLGHVDLGVPGQWAALSALLGEASA